MKYLFKSILILFTISLCLVACDKEDDVVQPASTTNNNGGGNNGGGNTGGGSNPNQDFYITGKMNGVDFLSKDDNRFTYARLFSIAGTEQHQLIGNGDSIGGASLYLQRRNGVGFNGVGRYDFANNSDASLSLNWIPSDRQVTYNADNDKYNRGWVDGYIDITSYDSSIIEGTFAFKAVNPDWSDPQNPDYSDSLRITEGKFRLQYK